MHKGVVKGQSVPPAMIAELPDSSALLADPAALRSRLQDDGFVFLRGAIDAAIVRAGRAEVLARLEAMDEIAPRTEIATGRSRRKELEPDLGRFWQSVSEGKRLREASHGRDIARIMTAIAGEPVRAQDYIFLRVGVPGRATGVHYDYPFFARAHDRVWTVWMPLGDVPVERGPLMVVEGSHRFGDIIEPMIGFDVARDTTRKADLGVDALELARTRGTRLLTTDFAAGDVMVFGMYLAHGSLDHHDESGIVRVSCDVRWQPARLPIDARYVGPNPAGTTGAGYGELNGAKPLNVDWHVR